MTVLLHFTKRFFLACALLFSANSYALTCSLDIDNDGNLDALTDGLLLMRHLFNSTGDALTENAVSANAQRSSAGDISAFLESPECQDFFDIDGDQQRDALTDGLMTMRYLFGFSGPALIQGAISSNATRTTETEITGLLDAKKTSFMDEDNNSGTALVVRVLPAVSEIANGDILTVSIVGSNFTTNTDGGSFELSWDDSVVNFTGITIADSLWDNSFDTRANTNPNPLNISVGNSAATGIGGDFEIATITFKVVGQPGEATSFLMVDAVGGWAQNGLLPVNKINVIYDTANIRVVTAPGSN
jgi:hypothetical protein